MAFTQAHREGALPAGCPVHMHQRERERAEQKEYIMVSNKHDDCEENIATKYNAIIRRLFGLVP